MGSGTFVLLLALLQQAPAAVPISVRHDGAPVLGAVVTCGAARAETGATGDLRIVPPVEGCTLTVTKDGLLPASTVLKPGSGPVTFALEQMPGVEEEVTVSATRSGRLASNQAVRVEVVAREEIEEKLLMTPGDIVMLLNETSGIRLQPTSPALGAASVRIQGLPGRYTSVLTDGLAINGTQVASIGLLQISPMDLQQVEVIKGAASALYGPSALGGVINLVTRRPTKTHIGEALVNVTSRSGADAVTFVTGPVGANAGYTLLSGGHFQNASDVDGDGWSDLPRYRRLVVRPKLSFTPGAGLLDLSGGLTVEHRRGGSLSRSDSAEAVDTTRVDLGGVFRKALGSSVVIAKAAASVSRHGHEYGLTAYDDRHESLTAEVAFVHGSGDQTLLFGYAQDRQVYRNPGVPGLDYTWNIGGVFGQADWQAEESMLSISARADLHSEYGVLVSPRFSFKSRPAGWDFRLSAGHGYFAPTPFVDEVEEVGVHRARIDHRSPLKAERAQTVSVDLGRRFGIVEISGTGFASRIANPVRATLSNSRLLLGNGPPQRTIGAEVFGRIRRGGLVATATYVWTRASMTVDDRFDTREPVALTPRHTASVVAAWERHGVGRVGVEVDHTGSQRLEDNPYRIESAPYTIIGLLGERRFGRVRVFINMENLTNVRQSNFDPLLRPTPSAVGRFVVSAWAPLEGRTFNGGIRLTF